jgi:hypothetical protein
LRKGRTGVHLPLALDNQGERVTEGDVNLLEEGVGGQEYPFITNCQIYVFFSLKFNIPVLDSWCWTTV